MKQKDLFKSETIPFSTIIDEKLLTAFKNRITELKKIGKTTTQRTVIESAILDFLAETDTYVETSKIRTAEKPL